MSEFRHTTIHDDNVTRIVEQLKRIADALERISPTPEQAEDAAFKRSVDVLKREAGPNFLATYRR